MADGLPGAVAGWLAMAAPALAVILRVGPLGKRARHPRVRSMLQCVVIASAALLVLAAVPIGREALESPLTIAIAAAALPVLLSRRLDTLWILGDSAAVSFGAALLGVA